MRSHRYRNPRVVLPRVDRARPSFGEMLPPSQADIARTDALAARYRASSVVAHVPALVDEVTADE